MKKRSSASTRIVAVTALVLAFVVAVIAISGAVGGDSGDSGGADRVIRGSQNADRAKRVPAAYEVKSGDTLISIAHRMGITVARIERLNPEVDPQILVAGEQLKLR